MKRAVFVVAILVALGAAFFIWDGYRFQNPDRASLAKEIEWFTNWRIADGGRILVAKRSPPSPLLGDYDACAFIELDEAGFASLKATIPPTETPSIEFSCVENERVDAVRQAYSFVDYAYAELEKDPSALYLVRVDETHRVVWFWLLVH